MRVTLQKKLYSSFIWGNDSLASHKPLSRPILQSSNTDQIFFFNQFYSPLILIRIFLPVSRPILQSCNNDQKFLSHFRKISACTIQLKPWDTLLAFQSLIFTFANSRHKTHFNKQFGRNKHILILIFCWCSCTQNSKVG